MAELTGRDWTTSYEKTRRERRLTRPLYPFAMTAARVAMLGVALIDPKSERVTLHERALLPDTVYQIPKIGSAGDSSTDKGRALSELYSRLMIDELLHFKLVRNNTASLVGPRGVTPEHRARLFDSVSGAEADEWRFILSSQRHGIIDSYSLGIHGKPGSGVSLDCEVALTDTEVANEAQTRLECNRRDFYNASRTYDNALLRKFIGMLSSRATGGRIG